MIIFRQSIPRRTFLRGVGGMVALPLLDAMIPALARAQEAKPPTRLGFVYVPNGQQMNHFTPTVEGTSFELPQILQPLAPYRDQLLVLSGLDSNQALGLADEAGGQHPRASASYLTGVHVVVRNIKTGLEEQRAGVSVDQVAARKLEKYTQLGSLELGIEPSELLCDGGCAYTNTICWRNATTPLPMINQPRAVFERLFGTADTTDPAAVMSRIKKRRSILDFVSADIARLYGDLGVNDRLRVNQYLDSIRDVERRIQMAEEQSDRELPEVRKPAGIPSTFTEHVKLMFDMQVLAYQTDITRIATLQMGHEMGNQAFPEIGIPDPHHPFTHHQGDPVKIAKALEIDKFLMRMFTYFLEKMRSTPDGDGSLLDHAMIVYGGGLGDGNLHISRDLPVLLIGGGSGQISGGRHIRYGETPLTNLHLTLLDKMEISLEKFGDSTGKLDLLSV